MRKLILTGLLLLVTTHQSTSFVDSHCDDDSNGSYEKGYKIEKSYREEIENTLKNDIGNSDRRVALSRYHSGTENSRIYKERNSNKERSGNEARGFPMSYERSIYARRTFRVNGNDVRRNVLENRVRSSKTRRNLDRRQGKAESQRQHRVDNARSDRLREDNHVRIAERRRTDRRFPVLKERDFRDLSRRSLEKESRRNISPIVARFIKSTDRRSDQNRVHLESRIDMKHRREKLVRLSDKREPNSFSVHFNRRTEREDVRIAMEKQRRSLERDYRFDDRRSSERREETSRRSVEADRTRYTRYMERLDQENRHIFIDNNRFNYRSRNDLSGKKHDTIYIRNAERRRSTFGVGETRRKRLADVYRKTNERKHPLNENRLASMRLVEKPSLSRTDARRFISLGAPRRTIEKSSLARDEFRRTSGNDKIISVRRMIEKHPIQRDVNRRSSYNDVILTSKGQMMERSSIQRDNSRRFSRDEVRKSSTRPLTAIISLQDSRLSRQFNERATLSRADKERVGDKRIAAMTYRQSNVAKHDNGFSYTGFDFVRAVCVIMMISQLAMYGQGEKSKLSFGSLLAPFSGWKNLKVE